MSSYLISFMAAVPLVLGIVLLVRALRGRRVDDHPICRGCGFDLFGKPEAQTLCSECGRSVAEPRAIRIGHRERSATAIFFGVMALLPGLGMIGLMIAMGFAGPQVDQHKPTRWLLAELSMAGPELRTRTLAELTKRLTSDNLSAAQIETVADHALAVQANRRIAWYPPWGEFVERARAKGQLPDAQWERYARQAVVGSRRIKVRPRVRRGDPIPIEIQDLPDRVGNSFTSRLMAVARKTTVAIDGIPIEANRGAGAWSLRPRDGEVDKNRIDLPPDVLAQLENGPHTLLQEYALRICAWETYFEPIAHTTLKIEAPIEIVPAEVETVKLRRGPPSEIRNLISVTRSPSPYGRFAVYVHVPRMPDTGIGYRVFARKSDGVEHELGLLAWQNPATSFGALFEVSLWVGDDPIDVILRPDIAAALQTTDVFEIYDEELVFTNVHFRKAPRYVR